jgi:hypothetical protein
MKHKQFGKPYMVRLFLEDEQKLSTLNGKNASEKIRNVVRSFLRDKDENLR